MKKLLIALLAVSVVTILVTIPACRKNPKATVSGNVVDESNSPVAGATVSAGNTTATTDGNGSFTLNSAPTGSSVMITVTSPYYYTGYKNIENIDGSSVKTQIMLISKPTPVTITGGAGTAYGPNGMQVTTQAGGFRTATGQPYTGDVQVYMRYIDAGDKEKISRLMPGGDFRATDANGNEGGLRTYGFTATEYTDANGNKLSPNAGKVQATVGLGNGVNDPIADGARAWAFNPTTGGWSDAGQLTNAGGQYYLPQTTVFQNMDKFIQYGYLVGRVVDCNGRPVAGVEVIATNPWDKYITYTNANGMYRFRAEAGGGGTYTITAGTGSTTAPWPPVGGTVNVSDITTDCNGGGGGGGTGTFTFNGSSYSGIATCAGSVAAVANTSGASAEIPNPPASGTVSITPDYYESGCTSCTGFQIVLNNGNSSYYARSGTITVSGNVITVHATLISTLDAGSANPTIYSGSCTLTCQ